MKFLGVFFSNKNKSESRILQKKVTSVVIQKALKNRLPEIESLKKYDRGEKTITPRSLTSTL